MRKRPIACVSASTALLFSLAGCVSTESVEQRPLTFAAETTKSADVYSTCVYEQWAEITPNAHRFSRPDGYRVRSYTGALLDVTTTATGAHVELREPPLDFWAQEKAARGCL